VRRAAPLLALLAGGCSPLLGLVVQAARSESQDIALGQVVSGSTRGASDDFAPSCGAPDGGGDRAHVFVPPRTRRYAVDVSAGYDSVVAVRDDAGEWIACNDDSDRASHSRVEATLEAGRRYTIVVDGYRGRTGDYRLVVEPIPDAPESEPASPAAPADPEGVLAVGAPMRGDTAAGSDRYSPPCGARPGTPDAVWRFTPPASGPYQLDVIARFDSLLAIYGPDGGEPLGCNDDFGSARRSRLVVSLEEGVEYAVVIDGYNGATGRYLLRASPVRSGGGTLALGQSVAGHTGVGSDRFTPSCGATPGSPEEVWRITIPQDGTYRFSVHAGFDAVVALIDQSGAELACNDDHGDPRVSRIEAPLARGDQLRVVVDGAGGLSGPYRLSVTPMTAEGSAPGDAAAPEDLTAICAEAPSLGPGLTAGRVIAAEHRVRASCGRGLGGESLYTVQVQAPTDLVVEAESRLRPVLELRDGCAGAPTVLACDAGTPSPVHARLSARLEPGRTYYLLVDTQTRGDGTFTLDATFSPVP